MTRDSVSFRRFRLVEVAIKKSGLVSAGRGAGRMEDEQTTLRLGSPEVPEDVADPSKPESWDERLLRHAEEHARWSQEELGRGRHPGLDPLLRIDLSHLKEGEPDLLTLALRALVVKYRQGPEPQKGFAPAVCVKWVARDRAAAALRSAVEWHWRLLDQEEGRAPTALVVEKGRRRLLGDLPPSMSGDRTKRLMRTRWVTYHALRLSDGPGNSPKALGRLMLRYAKLGLIRHRGRSSVEKLEALKIDTGDGPRGNVIVYESLLAAAAGEKPLVLRP